MMKTEYQPHFNIVTLSDSHDQTQLLYRGCERNYYEIIWISEGSGEYVVNESQYGVSSNTLFCGAPKQYHQLQTDKAVKGLIISFDYEFLHQAHERDDVNRILLAGEFINYVNIKVNHGVAAELCALTQKMQLELLSAQNMKMDIIKLYLHILLIIIRRNAKYSGEENRITNGTVKRFLREIEMNFIKKKSVSEYASMLCVTANYLNQIVKQETGGTAGYYIRRRIVAEAKRKALHSDQSMKQIAFSLGFDSEAHFSTFFKNYTGLSFSEFRRDSQRYAKPLSHLFINKDNDTPSHNAIQKAIASI